MTFDLLITGGTVADGNGGEPFVADVGICGDRIHAIGDLSGAEAREVIDATGLIVAPDFVDVHTHASHEAELRDCRRLHYCPPGRRPARPSPCPRAGSSPQKPTATPACNSSSSGAPAAQGSWWA